MPDMLSPGVRWFDDWFAIREVAPGVTAIGEPRFHQLNWNYLVIGEHTALMFDTGPGVRDIREVVRALTPLPVIAMPSHMHFDHVGNLHRFDDIAAADLPVLRQHEKDGILFEPVDRFVGHLEGMTWKPMRIHRWWPIGHRIDLGGRELEIIHTPGHAPDHVALWDKANNLLLAADFIYLGALYAQVKGANLADYARVTGELLKLINDQTLIFGAHGKPDDDGRHDAPHLYKQDLEDLLNTLKRLKESGEQPARLEVNDRMHLLMAPHAFAAWQKL